MAAGWVSSEIWRKTNTSQQIWRTANRCRSCAAKFRTDGSPPAKFREPPLTNGVDQCFEGDHLVAVDDAQGLGHSFEEPLPVAITEAGLRLLQTGAS